ncbi:hypothetical protein ALC57_13177 [Trachymyrmex cornetzi]|uniref:Uncharacterized protein n=1 Tax=Trachymyrmex cornetzi TaxID=471704 RepID=A0A151IZX1_9HYME|nr:hypothetical protein ALC57_13177 [Trachymyrmex cornetzi]
MSCVSMSAFFPPSIARVLTILFNHLLISLYQFFTKELGATIIAFSISGLASGPIQNTNIFLLYYSFYFLILSTLNTDHAMAYVVLVDVIQELVQIIGNQVLVFDYPGMFDHEDLGGMIAPNIGAVRCPVDSDIDTAGRELLHL